jgi:hypothetical protein
MIQFMAYAAAGGLLVGSLGTWYLTAEYKDAQWGAAVNEIKIAAANTLNAEVDRVRQVERASQDRVRELEMEHEQASDTLEALERSNRDLVAKLGGMRDPGRRPSRPNPVPSTATQAQCPEGTPSGDTGLLSAELTEALIAKAALADQMTEYAWVGYKWAVEVDGMYAGVKE